MIPGEIKTQPGEIEINVGRRTITVKVANSGELPLMGAALATPIFEMPNMKQMENSPGLKTPANASQR